MARIRHKIAIVAQEYRLWLAGRLILLACKVTPRARPESRAVYEGAVHALQRLSRLD
ncbi:hypothetical protein [Salipiger marinus]|uniref:Uncharacterized protein n=1 Tax=Salipiger marinus TaxID=555512 RepID=A0A1G8PUN2_9RHOB|nr:hypothetical protein [Salipiger marinus]SDI95580.1 hypothetical protein SAMN04487993_101398 [Salipiger marinus]